MTRRKYAPTGRALAYSEWHRTDSIRRFVDVAIASKMSGIDLDFLEFDPNTREPLILVETAEIRGQWNKQTYAMERLARRAGVLALLVMYKLSDDANPATQTTTALKDTAIPDIELFRVRVVYNPAKQCGSDEFRTYTPQQFAEKLVEWRAWMQRQIKN